MAATRRTPALRAAVVAALWLAFLPLLGRGALVEATSWIDAPLDGGVLPPAPYSIVAHSADQGGVAEVVFEVDGVQLRSSTDDRGLRFLTSRFPWSPPGLGTFVLTVRARNVDGEWGTPASATVLISDTAPTPGRTVEPGASPDGSPGASPSAGATAGPRQTPGATLAPGQTPGPAPTPGATRGATPAPAPTPGPTFCNPPTATLLHPVDYVELPWPSEAAPEFLWEYGGSTACITSQTLHIENQNLGVNLDIELGAGARSYQRRSAFDYDETDGNNCGHYSWYVMALNADGEGEPSAPGSFKICLPPNPDG